ncbi:MAG: helix-turn-helix transcriptional regulator [Planctomycetes bacterium]|nr:helix-turn-helix transcriptional regulator [Planctomycetota bacterium]
MGKIPQHLRETIARNITACRFEHFPGRGGGKRCAEAFGVSPQQWSPWERGLRTPDEIRLEQIAAFFGTSVEWLRTDHRAAKPLRPAQSLNNALSLPPGAPPLTCTISYHLLCQILDHSAHIQQLCARVLAENVERTEQVLGKGRSGPVTPG